MRLTLRGLTREFTPNRPLFDPLTEIFIPGEIIGVMGPSGSGKSTLLAMIAGQISPTAGEIEEIGCSKIVWVPQNPYGLPQRSALDHVVLPMLARGFNREEAERQARYLMSTYGIESFANQQFRTLSGGQAQRLMIARGVAANPDVLLVDEPTSQLDRQSAREVDCAIERLKESGMIVVVATHSEQTARACSRIIQLSDSREVLAL